jgi:lipid II:glycine glycyltransferase (peptidoglycan interpeptide bridge formation enzyme)
MQTRASLLVDLRGDEEIRRFHELVGGAAERGGWTSVRSLGYFRDLLGEFRSRGQGDLLVCELDGRMVGGGIRCAYGREGIALYAASERLPERPNYLLQWRSMEWCMERGCERYDLWGIPETVVTPDGLRDVPADAPGSWGVYHFKRQFGDTPILYTGAFDRPYIHPLYLLALQRMKRHRVAPELPS